MGKIAIALSGETEKLRLAAWLSQASCLAMMIAAAPVAAQAIQGGSAEPPPAAADSARQASLEEIVVTGSRITSSGFTAPTPTTVISVQQLQQSSQPNIFDSIAQLPALQGSAGLANRTQNGNTSIGSNGLSSLNLRGLGSIRTLTLLDGQRVVPAYITGIADVSAFPQLLIKRVDVVTGGASASWGSDAISGVVNFVTDTKFKGFKANVLGGISTYGDDKSYLAQVAAGTGLLDDRLHIEGSLEYFRNRGIPGGDVGGAQPNGRPDAFRSGTTSYALGAQPAGSPQYYAYPYNAQTTTLGRIGLITAGPLQGLAFNDQGGVYNFQYGTGCISNVCQGGQQDNYITTTTNDNPIKRGVAYGRVGYDVTSRWELYGNFSYAEVKTSNTPIAYPRKPANLTIPCTNPYLPTQIVTACAAARVTSFTYGTANITMPQREDIDTDRRQTRFVIGTQGSFDVGSKPVKFDAYYQHGINRANVDLYNITLNARYNAAIAATRNAAGQIVCSSAIATAEGCLPINIFTGTTLTDQQFAFLTSGAGPYQHNIFKEDVASLSFNATPFRDWAGDVSVAFGGEWRREYYRAKADPYGNGVTADSPNTAAYPSDPLLSAAGNNWFAGNYHNGTGTYNVREAFLELGIPLLDSQSLGKMNLNLAGRGEHYSTAGTAYTWKIGGTWDTPLEGFRLRAVASRDLRAPNLSELFAAPQTQNQNVINRATGNSVQLQVTTLGNTSLKPEIANTFEVGFAYRVPFVRGFTFSVDYYNIRLKQAISSLTSQQTVDLCYSGNQAYCALVKFTGTIGTADYPYVILQPFNLASLNARGLDFEASYVTRLGAKTTLTLRALATHALDLVSNTGIAGQQIAQLAGNNTDGGSGVPLWKAYLSQSIDHGPLNMSLTERYVSPGKIDPNAIVCQTNCPASTVQNPTYNFNHIPGALYLDIGGSYKITKAVQVYFKIDNVANHLPPPFGGTVLYDPIGRLFRLGARLAL